MYMVTQSPHQEKKAHKTQIHRLAYPEIGVIYAFDVKDT
jgi:hypothetical protein